MRLHRDSPPPDEFSELVIGDDKHGRVYITNEPRTINGGLDFFPAFAKSCAVIWGAQWHGPLERVCNLRKGAARRWMRDHEIPPPRIVAWVAYLSSRVDARAVGHALLAISYGGDSFGEAWKAWEGMRNER